MKSLRLTFWPYARRGFVPDAQGLAQVTATLAPGLAVRRGLPVMTAGDVTGIDARQVLRTDPADAAVDVSPNYLALIEFDRADLPWLFSPAPVDGRCQPWLMLVVVEETAGQALLEPGVLGERLRVDAALLPDPSQAWLWAHVQGLGDAGLPSEMAARMEGSISRLLCPTRLHPNRRYLACLVPTFLAGKLAGLGQTLTPVQHASREHAWNAASGEVVLPVYHRFRFATGATGDFESLVAALRGGPLPPGIGVRQLRLDHARSAMPAPDKPDLPMHAALYRPGAQLPQAAAVTGVPWLDTLRSRLVDAGFDISLVATQTPRVGPPLYGQFPAKALGMSPAELAAAPPWFAELNLDPRLRVAAGLGAQVVQREQERYMAEAWRQLDQVNRANALRRRGDYAIAASRSVYRRWIQRLDAGTLTATTSPLHKRLRLDHEALTLNGRLRQSPLPPEIVSMEFRRLTRAMGPRGAAFRQLSMDIGALTQRAADRRPLVAELAPDTIGRHDPPSSIWGIEIGAQMYASLVPAAAGLSPQLATAALDAMSHHVALTVPSPAQIETQVRALGPRLDDFLSRNGLLPAAQVAAALHPPGAPTPPPDVPPVVPPVDHRRPDTHGRFDDTLPPTRRRIPIPIQPPLAPRPRVFAEARQTQTQTHTQTPTPTPTQVPPVVLAVGNRIVLRPVDRFDHVVQVDRDRSALNLNRWSDSASSAYARLPQAELGGVLQRWRNDGVVSVSGDGAVSIDALAIDRSSRSGTDATTVTPDFAAAVLAGTYRAPAAAAIDFRFDAATRVTVTDEASSAVRALGRRLLRETDAPALVTRPLAAQFADFTTVLLRELEPAHAITRLVNARISGLSLEQARSRDEILAAPDLSEPTFLRLAGLSQDWILPGIGKLPPNTTTLAAANRSFISAFLVGMNHELGREMVWREYPTDQRGSPARQFWAHRSSGDPQGHYDLRKPLHLATGAGLAGLMGDGAGDPLVLVVRGEVVRRFPGLIVQAATTVPSGVGARRTMGAVIEPDFFGRLEPDVLLVGFSTLTEGTVRAAAASPDTALWFFFSEHFAEPRFGLDESTVPPAPKPESWNAASWDHVTTAPGPVPYLTPTSNTLSRPKAPGGAVHYDWGADSASQAWICLQFPFRRGLRAIDLLPPVAGG